MLDAMTAWPGAMGRTILVSPDGPQDARLFPGGREWYSITNITEAAVERSAAVRASLRTWFEQCLERLDVDASRAVAIGFSQGAIVGHALLAPRPLVGRGAFVGCPVSTLSEEAVLPAAYLVGDRDRFVDHVRLAADLAERELQYRLELFAGMSHEVGPPAVAALWRDQILSRTNPHPT